MFDLAQGKYVDKNCKFKQHITKHETTQLFGDFCDHRVVEIPGVGADFRELEQAAAWPTGQSDIMAEEPLPLTGLAVQIHSVVIRDITYLARVAVPDGELMDLDMVPIQLRNFRINRPGDADIQWLHQVIAREYGRFGGKVEVISNGTMRLISV